MDRMKNIFDQRAFNYFYMYVCLSVVNEPSRCVFMSCGRVRLKPTVILRSFWFVRLDVLGVFIFISRQSCIDKFH